MISRTTIDNNHDRHCSATNPNNIHLASDNTRRSEERGRIFDNSEIGNAIRRQAHRFKHTQMLNSGAHSAYSIEHHHQHLGHHHQQQHHKQAHSLSQVYCQRAPLVGAKRDDFAEIGSIAAATAQTIAAAARRSNQHPPFHQPSHPNSHLETSTAERRLHERLDVHSDGLMAGTWPPAPAANGARQYSSQQLLLDYYRRHDQTGRGGLIGGERKKLIKIKHNTTSTTTTTTTSTFIHTEPHRVPHGYRSSGSSFSGGGGDGNNNSSPSLQQRGHSNNYLGSIHPGQPAFKREPDDIKVAPNLSFEGTDSSSVPNVAKCIEDLPLFVTVEGHRVASYSIAGEPHVCLPQLLQYLRQKFTLKRMVDKFEETAVNFTSATPVQIDGFKKACVLPANAQNCPLIKLSDADRICLALYEQCYKGPKNDIVDICQSTNRLTEIDSGTAVTKANDYYKGDSTPDVTVQQNPMPSASTASRTMYQLSESSLSTLKSSEQTIVDQRKSRADSLNSNDETNGETTDNSLRVTINHRETTTQNRLADGGANNNSSSISPQSSSITRDNDRNQELISCDLQKSSAPSTGSIDSLPHDLTLVVDGQQKPERSKNLSTSASVVNEGHSIMNGGGPLFDSEVQDSILTLAKAVTSTLKIRVYHKCFGKCVGLFYPTLLKSHKSYCIECTSCHIMLTPRRFIGHTHGAREKNVCHWGFNSYNWKFYIRLSKKQPMNNLADDELLVQFKTLLSTWNSHSKIVPLKYSSSSSSPLSDDEEDEYYEFDKPDLEDVRKEVNHLEANGGGSFTRNNSYQQYNYYSHSEHRNQLDMLNYKTLHTQSSDRLNSNFWNLYYETELMKHQQMDDQKLSLTKSTPSQVKLPYADHFYGRYLVETDLKHSVNQSVHSQRELRPSILHFATHQTSPSVLSTQLSSPQLANDLPIGIRGYEQPFLNSHYSANKNSGKRPYLALDYDCADLGDKYSYQSFLREQHSNRYLYQRGAGSAKRRASDFQYSFTELTNNINNLDVEEIFGPTYRYRTSSSGSKAYNLFQDNRQRSNYQRLQSQILSRQSKPRFEDCATDFGMGFARQLRQPEETPVFVMIESYRIAAFPIAGEPHLCLPQLLQYLRQRFTLKRMVDKFEETIISFSSATPAQVNGFKKACVLPTSAETCPLIKRSDADRICLSLYEDCYKGFKNDIVEICESANKVSEKLKFSSVETKSNGFIRNDSAGNVNGSSQITTAELSDKDLLEVQATTDSSSLESSLQTLINQYVSHAGSMNSIRQLIRQHANDTLLNKHDGPLFDGEAQNSILCLAKAVSSTLKIRIYHKCFGKSVGLFYPNLLRNFTSYCIECANCHIMLTPRRFIGHTHGLKEKNVCHWGFNSYNWNFYIRLSKKQPMNNLADDELLIQFKTLLSHGEMSSIEEQATAQSSDEEYYEFDKPDLDEDSKHLEDKINTNNIKSQQYLNICQQQSYELPV